MNNKKKKKGFTLIELIAVIAILAILGVILVPKVSGYTAKANAAKDLANAKQLLQAVEMYNQANETTQIGGTGGSTTITTALLSPYTSMPTVRPKTVTTTMTSAKIALLTANSGWDGMAYTDLKAYAQELEAAQP